MKKMIRIIHDMKDLAPLVGGNGNYVRADLLGETDLPAHIFSGETSIYALRSQAEGGAYLGSLATRHEALVQAAASFNLIELEGERDLVPFVLKHISPAQRLISWHGAASKLEALSARLARYRQVPAAYYQLVPFATRSGDEIPPLALLSQQSSPKDLITYAAGPIGRWTQIVAAFLGAPMVYFVEESTPAETFFTHTQLVSDYHLPNTYPIKQLFGIVGNPIFRSLSPRLHNHAYRQLGLPYLYLPMQVEVFADFWKMIKSNQASSLLGLEFCGFTTVSPMKEMAFQTADTCHNDHVLASQASNLLVKRGQKWLASSTDDFGLKKALEDAEIAISGLKVAIVGCGGAGRTMAAYLKANGAQVTLVNRSLKRGQFAAQQLVLPFTLKKAFSPGTYQLVINATPLGKRPNQLAFDPNLMPSNGIVIDMSYAPHETQMIRMARLRGLKAIDGRQMLQYQVAQQFQEMTGEAERSSVRLFEGSSVEPAPKTPV